MPPPKSAVSADQLTPVDTNTTTLDPEYEKYSGTWQIEARVDDGIEAPWEQLKDVRVVINKDIYSVYVGEDVVMNNWVWQLNSANAPTSYEIKVLDGPDKGKTMYGICEIDGDTSRYCDVVGTNPSLRPKEFTAPIGSGRRLFVYKRIKR